MSKVIHRAVRGVQSVFFEDYMQSQQIGGRRRLPVNLAVHQGRMYQRRNLAQGRSTALIFLDLREAFYRVVRELSVGGFLADGQVLKLAQRFHLTPEETSDSHQL